MVFRDLFPWTLWGHLRVFHPRLDRSRSCLLLIDLTSLLPPSPVDLDLGTGGCFPSPGRVGRGTRKGLAILIADPKTEDASRRLATLESSDSGFDIAEEDLRIRGAGEWLGKRQAGHLPELRLADLVRHGELLGPVREAAQRLIRHDPGLKTHPALRAAIANRWGRRLDFSDIA